MCRKASRVGTNTVRTGIRYSVNNSLTVWTLFYGMLLLWNPVAMNSIYLGKNNETFRFKDENDYEYEI